MRNLLALLFTCCLIHSCQAPVKELPIIGEREELPNGEIKYHTIPDFNFISQVGDTITRAAFYNKVYVADFFLTGDKDELLDIADEYYVAAFEDPDAPGGFDHSGKILLIDTKGHIRAFCDGTDPEDVDDFMKDIDILMKEYEL